MNETNLVSNLPVLQQTVTQCAVALSSLIGGLGVLLAFFGRWIHASQNGQSAAGAIFAGTNAPSKTLSGGPAPLPAPGSPAMGPRALSVALCGGLIAFWGGCTTANTAALKTAQTSQVAVSTAMNLWGAYVASQKAAGTPVPPGTEQNVEDAYLKYQHAMSAVCDAGAVWAAASGTNSAGATGFQAALDAATATAAQSISDLEALITGFGVKLQ